MCARARIDIPRSLEKSSQLENSRRVAGVDVRFDTRATSGDLAHGRIGRAREEGEAEGRAKSKSIIARTFA